MRDLLVLGIVFAASLAALRLPWIGVLAWTWVSIMNPHKQAWALAQDFPVAAVVGGATLLGLMMTRDRRNPFIDPSVVLLAMFMAWICIGFPFSFFPEDSKDMLSKVLKVDLMILVTIALIITRRQIEWFIWVVVFSLGYYGMKGGVFTIVHGGNYKVWGPGGFIGGNNEVALAFVVVIPLMYYLFQVSANKWVKRGLLVSMPLTAIAALGSHSRGALLAVSAMGLFLWLRSDRKMVLGPLLAVLAVASIAFMPEEWMLRMQTIENYQEDASAMGRINAWSMAWNLALDRPLTGGGFAIYEPMVFQRYAPNPLDIHAAHSVYFQVLGEHGLAGLALWIGIFFFTWRTAGWLRKCNHVEAGVPWCRYLGSMCQVSLVGYAVGGTFLSLAYFDLPYNILAIVVCAKAYVVSTTASNSVGRASMLSPEGAR